VREVSAGHVRRESFRKLFLPRHSTWFGCRTSPQPSSLYADFAGSRHHQKFMRLFQVGDLTSIGTDIGFTRRHEAMSFEPPSESCSSPDRSWSSASSARGRAEPLTNEGPVASFILERANQSQGWGAKPRAVRGAVLVACSRAEARLPKGCWLPSSKGGEGPERFRSAMGRMRKTFVMFRPQGGGRQAPVATAIARWFAARRRRSDIGSN
jgi:hypothetical protein